MNLKISSLAAPRDEQLIRRLSGMTMASDLPADLEHITGPRLEIIRQSWLYRYWNFMAGTGSPTWMPVPHSIMDPGSPGWLKASMEPGPERRESVLLDLYNLSTQERIQFQDSMRYTVLTWGRNRPTGERLRAYARRVCLQLNGILNTQGLDLQADIYQLPRTDGITACRFTTLEVTGENGWDPKRKPRMKPDQETVVRMEITLSRAELLEMLPGEARAAVSRMGPVQESLRIYAERAIWTIAAAQERRWSEAQTLRDADEILAEHPTADWRIRQGG